MESLPFDGIQRLSASKIPAISELAAAAMPAAGAIRMTRNGKAVISRINSAPCLRSLNLITKYPAGWFRRFPSKLFPQAGFTEDFSHIRPTRSLADMPPNEGRASTALNRV